MVVVDLQGILVARMAASGRASITAARLQSLYCVPVLICRPIVVFEKIHPLLGSQLTVHCISSHTCRVREVHNSY